MHQINVSPFPEFRLDKIVLRPLRVSDQTRMFSLRTNQQVNRYIDRPVPADKKDILSFIRKISGGIERNEWLYWAIALNETDEMIGTICLWNFSENGKRAETGFEIFPEWQGKGLMSLALSNVIDFGRVSGMATIDAYTHPENMAAIGLLKKSGFIFNKFASEAYVIENPASFPLQVYSLDI